MTTAMESPTTRRLSPAEIAAYERDGFVEVADFFPIDELRAIDAEISRLRADKAIDQNPHILLRLGLRSDLTRRICEDPRILDLIEDIVKPGIAIYSAKMVEKPPHDPIVCHWHQDDAYYQQNSQSACRMSIWIPLQDCDESNGCVWMVPGSHRRGLQEYRNRSEGTCTLSFADGRDDMPGAVPMPIKAGSVLLFHALTWHRSLGNRSDRTRRSFIVSYQDARATRGNKDQHKILRAA